MGKDYVAYYRVSTQTQNIGLEAQKTMVKNYLKDKLPIQSFTEKESGKCDKNRPQLQKALELCKQKKAVLIVATLSRLSRDLHFITSLSKSRIDFKCCDMPDATPLTINLMGAIAQYERETISNRTKRALAELKKDGVALGANRPEVKAGLDRHRDKIKKEKLKRLKTQALKPKVKITKPTISKIYLEDQKVIPVIKSLRNRKLTWQAIVDDLNENKVKTRVRGQWHRTSVKRVADRHDIL